jgi:hypothetical protein
MLKTPLFSGVFIVILIDMNANKKYWMKRRRYGWGWTPTTWQGWLFIFSQTIILLIAASQLPTKAIHPSVDQVLKLLAILVCVFLALITVGSQTGPMPHWRWGKEVTDKPDEDF